MIKQVGHRHQALAALGVDVKSAWCHQTRRAEKSGEPWKKRFRL